MEDNRPPRIGAGVKLPVTLSIAVLLLCAPAACPQSEAVLPELGADQVVQRLLEKNKERADGLQHYLGKRSYRLEYRGFPTSADATMEVEVNFDAPASKRFTIVSSTGSKLILNRVFHRLLESEAAGRELEQPKAHRARSGQLYLFPCRYGGDQLCAEC